MFFSYYGRVLVASCGRIEGVKTKFFDDIVNNRLELPVEEITVLTTLGMLWNFFQPNRSCKATFNLTLKNLPSAQYFVMIEGVEHNPLRIIVQ